MTIQDKSIPSIAELRQRVYKENSIWISKVLIRPYVSIHFTRLFLLLGFTGIQVTFVMMLCAFAGAGLFFVGSTAAYIGGAVLMLLSWVLDNSDGEVRTFRGEDSNVAVYLDLFTHRVSYPLVHLGMGVSLYRQTGVVGELLFGAAVAYFYQLGVAHSLDKQLIAIRRGGVDPDPIRTVRLRLAASLPPLALPLKILVSVYTQLIQNVPFVILLIVAALLDHVNVFYLGYGALMIFNWFLRTWLDYTVVFPWNKAFTAPYGSRTTCEVATNADDAYHPPSAIRHPPSL